MKCIGLDCEDCIQIEKRLSSNAFYAANFAGLNEALARQIVPPGTAKLLKVREGSERRSWKFIFIPRWGEVKQL